MAEVLCPQEERVVGEDWCVRYENRILQIAKRHEALALAGRKIRVLLFVAVLAVPLRPRGQFWPAGSPPRQ